MTTTNDQPEFLWYTPDNLILAIQEVFYTGIDLDPASDPVANERVRAREYFILEDNALDRSWDADTLYCCCLLYTSPSPRDS